MKRPPKATDFDAYRHNDHTLVAYMLSGVELSEDEVWTKPVDED